MKKYFLFLLLGVLTAFRFIYAEEIPVGLSNDEIEYSSSAESYALYKHDISGYNLPLSLIKTETDGVISPVPPVLTSLLFKMVPFSQENIRIFYILLNTLTAIPLYFIAESLFPKKRIGILSVIFFLINPWSIFLSRTAMDTPYVLLFYLCGIASLLRSKGWRLVVPFVFFALAFFSYHGGKFIFLPIIFVTLIYKYFSQDKKPTHLVLFAIASILLVLIFVSASMAIPGSTLTSRSEELFFNNSAYTSQLVDNKRAQTIDSPLINIFLNKGTEISKVFFKQYLTAFSPEVLFISGDLRATYRFGDHGLFYLIDAVLILIGLAGIYSKNKRKFFFITMLILVSPIATAVSRVEISIINRSFLLLPLFVLLSSYGLTELVNLVMNKTLKVVIVASLIFILGLSFVNFAIFYFFRFPVTAQENYWLSERILYKYLSLGSANQETIIITDRPRSAYLRYLLTERVPVPEVPIPHASDNSVYTYQINNTTFTSECPTIFNQQTLYAIHTSRDCNLDQNPNLTITDQKDAGALINIYNSEACKDISKEPYRRFNKLSYYNLEKLNYEDFCRSWIFTP